MAAIHYKYKTSHQCCFILNNSYFLRLLLTFFILQDCKAGVIFYDDTSEGEADEGPWVPSNPFIGQRFSKRLMAARGTIGDWERAQFQRGHIHSQGIDDVFKMGEGATFKRGDLRISWSDNDDSTTAFFQEPGWSQMQLPVLLSVFALIGGLGLSLVILIWLNNQMSTSENEKEDMGEGIGDAEGVGHTEGGQWIYHPVIKPMTTQQCENVPVVPLQPQAVHAILPEVMTARCLEGDEKRAEPIRIKAKGLLERRGSSASLTIDLLHPSQENLSVTPTRECTAEEYLLSVGNVLSRGQLRSCLKDVRPLHREFWDLPLNHPEKLEVPGSGIKNRYRTIIPNETTRVHLPTEDGSNDPLASYINANYIRGYDGEEKAFIATQGPLAHTVIDFWLMVWTEKAPVIVMITKLWEKSRSKCEPYFPNDPGASATYGSIAITVASVHVKDGYIVRHLDLQKGEDSHRVVHFWFDSWPDHKTPANAHSLLCLAKDVDVSRFLGPSQRRNSPSTWPLPNREKLSGIAEPAKSTIDSAELLSPCPEANSPLSLKDTSPILNFGRLEFKEDEPEKENKSSPREDNESQHLICLVCDVPDVFTPTPVDKTVEAVNLEFLKSKNLNEDLKTDVTMYLRTKKDTASSSGFFEHYSYNTDEVFKYGSLPQDSSMTHSRIDLENSRSKSVETPPTWVKLSKDFDATTEQKASGTTDFFDFDKLSITHDSFRSKSTDDSHPVDEISRQDSLGGKSDTNKSFDSRQAHGAVSTSSPNWTSMTSPNLTQSFDKSMSKLSVDSPSWALEMSPHLSSEKSPHRTHSSVESPNLTHSSNESKRWTHSSDSSKHWTHSSMGSSVWAQSSEDSPRWLEKDEEPPVSASRIKSPGWFSSFDRSPLFSRRSREGSISLFWGDMQRGTAAGPVIVHCSAGIGRTGCFIAICVGINQLLGENNVDILGIVCRMRYDRGGMVQTAEQYEFIHRALALFERSLPDQSGE